MRPEPMGVAMFRVDDIDDLVLLQRVIAAGRFHSGFGEFIGSARLAALHSLVFDEIVRAKGQVDADRPDGWTAWRQLANNSEHADLVVEHVAQGDWFVSLNREDQLNYLRVCVAPFVASDTEMQALLDRAVASARR